MEAILESGDTVGGFTFPDSTCGVDSDDGADSDGDEDSQPDDITCVPGKNPEDWVSALPPCAVASILSQRRTNLSNLSLS